MIVHIISDHVSLTEAVDTSRFHVSSGLTPAELDRELRAAGAGSALAEDSARIECAYIVATARTQGHGDEWESSFNAMLEYARAKGWVTQDGLGIIAHIERG